jgi:nucleotide-binding universal stress UspA family protein
MKVQTILVPTDRSPDARAALVMARDLARALGSRIVILHAYRVDLPLATPELGAGLMLPDRFYEELRASATSQVEVLAAAIEKEGVRAEGIAVEDRPAQAIVAAAKRLPADLIVMGTRGLTGLKHVMLGSPVLTVKATE